MFPKPLKPAFTKQSPTTLRKKRSRRFGWCTVICVILLLLLILFYVSVASYLLGEPFNKSSGDPRKTKSVSLSPDIESYKIPKIPQHQFEDKNFMPPHPGHGIDHQQQLQSDSRPDTQTSTATQTSSSSCPPKYPRQVPMLSELPHICANLKSFDIRHSESCTLETCEECVPPTHTRMTTENEQTAAWQKQFEDTKRERRDLLRSLVGHLRPKSDGPVILMVFNYGYAWLFYNLLCSLEANHIDIRNRSIVVTTDRMSQSLVAETGFMTHYPHWLGPTILNRITPKAAASFALGAHKWIVSIQIALITDLVDMGYDVLMQDIDLVWHRSPLPYLMQPQFQHLDIQMSVDGTMGLRGPGNSGFFVVRSNCKMKVFMQTMVSLIGLIMTGRSDQMLWNALLQEKRFRMVSFETLTTDKFISGYQVNLAHQTKRANLPSEHFIVHASWTTDQWDKIEKFYNVEHWYFTRDKCPQWYNFSFLPDLAERKWHIRDKTQEQEQKFKALGLFRDSTNGVYAKSKKR